MAAPAELELVGVELGPPEPRGPIDLDTGEPPLWRELALNVRNSADTTLYAMASIRRMRWDAASATLFLDLDDHAVADAESSPFIRHLVLPDFQTIGPRESGTVRVQVPEVINWITVSAGPRRETSVTTLDLASVQRVHCKLAVSTRPFEPDAKAAADELLSQLGSWGEVVEATFPMPRPDESGRVPPQSE